MTNLLFHLDHVAVSGMNCVTSANRDNGSLTGIKALGQLDPDQITILGAEFDQIEERLPILGAELSEEEWRRSRCFHFERDRQKFIAARGLLRLLLGHYADCTPSRIQFAYNAHGKPSLVGSMLEFNISHSGNRLLYGFAANQQIGVDIEKVRTGLYAEAIARENFAPGEVEVLKRNPDAAVDTFFTYWTCKEAVLKGMGQGITCRLQDIDLSSMVEQSRGSFSFPLAGSPATSWVVTRLNHLPGYAGAVALQGAEKPLVYSEITRETLDCIASETGRR